MVRILNNEKCLGFFVSPITANIGHHFLWSRFNRSI